MLRGLLLRISSRTNVAGFWEAYFISAARRANSRWANSCEMFQRMKGRNTTPAIPAAAQGQGVRSHRRCVVAIMPRAMPNASHPALILFSIPSPSSSSEEQPCRGTLLIDEVEQDEKGERPEEDVEDIHRIDAADPQADGRKSSGETCQDLCGGSASETPGEDPGKQDRCRPGNGGEQPHGECGVSEHDLACVRIQMESGG